MTEEEVYTDVDIAEVVEDSEQYSISENLNIIEADTSVINETELNNSEVQSSAEKKTPTSKTEVVKSTRLPIARIKSIMKMDPDVHMINSDAAFVVTKATEMFLETIAKEIFSFSKKKKILTKKDLDSVIELVDCLCFLDGALDF